MHVDFAAVREPSSSARLLLQTAGDKLTAAKVVWANGKWGGIRSAGEGPKARDRKATS